MALKGDITGVGNNEISADSYASRGWGIKKFTNVFCHTAKMTSPRVKNQARG